MHFCGAARRVVVALVAALVAAASAVRGADCPCHANGPLAIPTSCLSSLDDANPIAALRLRLDRDPSDQQARVQLLDTAPNRPLPKESAAYEAVREVLPAQFVEFQTRRFIILSDANPDWTRAQSERLERSHHQFNRFCARLGLDPLPLEHKLVCVLFENRADYRDFAAAHDDVHDAWVAGYYSPRYDRIVFYNVESDPQLESARIKLDAMEREIGEISERANRLVQAGLERQAQELRQTLARYKEQVLRERSRVNAFSHQVSIATTIHEAIHQLAFHTRIQSPHVQNPLWFSEGIATTFETEAPNAAFGPEHEYGPRRRAFAELLAAKELLPLSELVPLMSLSGAEEKVVRTFYHQSYALVTWMSRFRRMELRDYIDALRSEPPGRLTSARQMELFEESFGNVAAIERAWLRHEQSQLMRVDIDDPVDQRTLITHCPELEF